MSGADRGILLVLSGPSGAGKTTLCSALLRAEQRLFRIVTCTTRPPREGEEDGIDYHFLSPAGFREREERGEFLERAEVYGNRYGTLRAGVMEHLGEGRDVLLTIDVLGARQVRECAALRDPLVSVFLVPPSPGELERRLRERGADPRTSIAPRLEAARREVEASGEFDYLIISGTREEDLRRLRSVLEAERLRRKRARFPHWAPPGEGRER